MSEFVPRRTCLAFVNASANVLANSLTTAKGNTTLSALASAVALALIISVAPATVSAQSACIAADSDPDGDGWGWENGASCVVSGSQAAAPTAPQSDFCLFQSSDDDGDGWGWENNSSCRVGPDTSTNTPVSQAANFEPVVDSRGRNLCQSPTADPDGDGYGWENNASCLVDGSAVATVVQAPVNPVCTSSAADPDNDGWGWENNASCIVGITDRSNTPDRTDSTASSDTTGSSETPDDSNTTDSADTTDDSDATDSANTPDDSNTTDSANTPDDSDTTDSTNTPDDSDTTDSTNTPDDSDTTDSANITDDSNNTDNANTTDDSNTADATNTTETDYTGYHADDITDLILVTGQSNTLGSNSGWNETQDAPHPRVFAYTREGWQVAQLHQSWDRGSHPGTGNPDDVDQIHNNFALHFGKRLAELDENIVVGFILVSEPGEGIEHWTPGGTGLLRVQQKTLEAINALPSKFALDGILWHQGETDWILEGTSDPDVEQPAPVDYYPMSLSALIENLRLENWYDPQTPFICGETIRAEGVNTHLNTLNTDNDPVTACVEGAGLASITEGGSHFNGPALRTLGQRYAEAYNRLR